MTGLIVLGVAFVFFLVVAFFCAKTWQVGHVVAMAFLFLFTLVMVFLTATLFRTYEKFQPKYQAAVASLAQEEAKTRRLTFGSDGEAAGAGSLKGEQALAREEQFGRGRIWRNVYAQVAPGNPEIRLQMGRWTNDGVLTIGKEEDELEPIPDDTLDDTLPAEEDPADAVDDAAEEDPADAVDDGNGIDDAAADDPAATDGAGDGGGDGADAGGAAVVANPHGIVEGQFVYAFKEFPIRRWLTPAEKAHYFGDLSDGEENFADTDRRDQCRVPGVYLGKFRVTQQNDQLLTVLPESRLNQAQTQQIGSPGSWVLYEKLPMDSHDLFAGIEAEKIAGLVPLKRLNDFGNRLSQATYQAMVGEYVRDGQEVAGQAPPMRVSVPVSFKQSHEVVVDLEVEGGLPETDQPFNVEGRAQVQSLLQDGPTKFEANEVAHFDGVTANRLVQQGIAERAGNPTYHRRLRDFAFELHDSEVRADTLSGELTLVTKEVQALQASLDRLQAQTDKLKVETGKLQQDLVGFNAERDSLMVYLNALQGRAQRLRREINRLVASR